MATVRNIRNMIMAGISDEVVKMAVYYLTNEKAVVKSRMFPYRFYTAYDILDQLKDFKEKNYQVYGRKPIKYNESTEAEIKKFEGLEKKFAELKRKQATMNDTAIEQFKNALDKAVEIATHQNIPPIKGITIILLQLTETRPETKLKPGILFALMILKSCETAKLFVSSSQKGAEGQHYEVSVKVNENSLLGLVKELENMIDYRLGYEGYESSNHSIKVHDRQVHAIDLIR